MLQNCWKERQTTAYAVYGIGSEKKESLLSPVSHELLSMIMYAIELNPLLTTLAEGLEGLKTKPTCSKLSLLCLCGRYDNHSHVTGWCLGSKGHTTLAPTCCRCKCQPSKIRSPTTWQKNTEIDTMGIPYENVFVRFHATIVDKTQCAHGPLLLLTPDTHSAPARLHNLNRPQRVRYVIFQFSRLGYQTQ